MSRCKGRSTQLCMALFLLDFFPCCACIRQMLKVSFPADPPATGPTCTCTLKVNIVCTFYSVPTLPEVDACLPGMRNEADGKDDGRGPRGKEHQCTEQGSFVPSLLHLQVTNLFSFEVQCPSAEVINTGSKVSFSAFLPIAISSP